MPGCYQAKASHASRRPRRAAGASPVRRSGRSRAWGVAALLGAGLLFLAATAGAQHLIAPEIGIRSFSGEAGDVVDPGFVIGLSYARVLGGWGYLGSARGALAGAEGGMVWTRGGRRGLGLGVRAVHSFWSARRSGSGGTNSFSFIANGSFVLPR